MLKGLFMHVLAKVVFVLCTYIIHLYLGKNLSAAEYGTIGVVITIITVNYNFLSNGARQSVSKLLASESYDEKSIIKRGSTVQFIVAVILTLINFFGAPFLAKLLNANNMETYIKFSAIMIPFTAGYFLCVGSINGLKKFSVEAIIVTIYPLLRLTIIPYFKYVFEDSAIATVSGFFTAAAVCFLISGLYLMSVLHKAPRKERQVTNKIFFGNMSNFLIFFTCITLILNLDMLFVNALVQEQNQVGYYTGAVNFSKVSYYLLSAVYIVVLPTVSSLYSNKKIEEARKVINTLMSLICLFILPIVSIVGGTTKQMLTSFYRAEYADASVTATVLMISQFLIGLFVVLNMCVSATQSNKFSTILSIIVTGINIILCWLLTQRYMILGAAIASLCSSLFGCILTFIQIVKIYGNIISKETIKLIIFDFILFLVSCVFSKLIEEINLVFLFGFYFVIYILFVGIIIIAKQVNIEEIVKILRRK